ncbi:MAG: 16S rRNA (cytosine967-C5)-methyltransferase [Roseibaca calidilacus]|uniref:16S rRNA (Cytosine967-C5)-methyltransferase n=1 Tax=Roseibaca calidilacus TaxID=1666912 RepID=A0A0P8AH19_9RHOB|nr:methyltransferase domain-containing protein [Roseibaca calidilacus]KPP93589.1 MAG: 16S rRNA (cytosine967-C5)-methyltransferase [Roseibaca calidilacus]CUX80404.1 16S rRNA (cytosine967-C5)-methyltransferase [Roseibaca calidilacus]
MPDAQPSHAPRAAAHALVMAVVSEARSLAEVQPRPYAALPPEGQARALRLALAGFRHHGRADHLLRGPLRKTPPEIVLWALRLAVVEMGAMQAPAHGVINDTVALLNRVAPKFAGLGNAVLRRVADGLPGAWAAAPAPRLPGWLRGALQNAYGNAATVAIEAAQEIAPPLDLSLRGPCPEGLDGVSLPTGTLRLPAGQQVSALPGYAAGAFWVQDAASALPARWLAGHARVLDLCAAPGGKTMQLAAQGADVTALDLSDTRLERLRANLSRTGLAATVVCADALTWTPDQPFDAVLLDAPCSATGTIRRHPELPLLKTKEGLHALRDLQTRLLDRVLDPASGLVKPGGEVVYCTCSLLPAEGEEQITAALQRHPGARLLHRAITGVPPAWQSPQGPIRTRPDYWPEHGGLDGFYMALIATSA